MSARLSSAQLVCSSRSPPPQHFPTVPLLSRCLTYGGVLKGDRQRSPDTPHLVPTNTSAPAEKNTCARFSLEPITPVFFVVFFALPPFLPPSRCGDGSSCSCHCSYSPGPGGPYRVNCIISRRASPPASLLTVQLKAAPRTDLQPRYILRPEAGVGAIK